MKDRETMQNLQRFGSDILDLSEVVALVNRTVYLRDGREMGVVVATAERPAAARALMEELPSLLPADPEMAAVLEEEMAKAFADAVEEGPEVAEGGETIRNAEGKPILSQEEAERIYHEIMGDGDDDA